MAEAVQTEAVYDALGDVLARWTMGAAAAPVATMWRAEIGEEAAEAELRLLALSGQFLAVSVAAAPPGELRTLADIPTLALPSLPDPLRPLARRLLRDLKEARLRQDLLVFLAKRGWTMHPDDWLPAPAEEPIPDVYAPWRDWADASVSLRPASRGASAELSIETWAAFGPAARLAVLADLRRRDPAAAVALMAAKFGSEGAEERLRLLGVLAMGLSQTDRAFLERLVATDRASKVKALAASLLARIGYGQTGSEDATELAGFFEVGSKGLPRRARVVKAQALKTPAQHHRRQQLFSGVDLAGFAAALNLAPDALAAAWTWKDDAGSDMQFAAMLERSAPDTVIAGVVAQFRDLDAAAVSVIVALQPRLDVSQRADVVRRLLRHDVPFQSLLWIARGDCEVDVSMQCPACVSILKGLAAASRSDQSAELQALGLIATREAAKRAMEQIQTTGVLGIDPRLDMLRLNAALNRGTNG